MVASAMTAAAKTGSVLALLSVVFLGLILAFLADPWGRAVGSASIPLVESNFISTATARVSAADLIRTGGDTSDLDCYACHDKKQPPKLTLDAEGNVVIPKEHS